MVDARIHAPVCSTAAIRPALPRFFLERALFEAVRRFGSPACSCLNLGAGPHGRYAALFDGMTVDAVDIAPAEGTQPWRYHQADAASLPFPDQSFDLVVSVEAFEHIDENRRAMGEVQRVLKPGAVLVMTTPTAWTWPFELGTHGPHYYSAKTLKRLVEDAGLEVQEVRELGGFLTWAAGLTKSWVSVPGFKLFGSGWWRFIDDVFTPAYWAAARLDAILRFPPSNYLLVGRKRSFD